MIFPCGPLRAQDAIEVECAQHIQSQTSTSHSRENPSISMRAHGAASILKAAAEAWAAEAWAAHS